MLCPRCKRPLFKRATSGGVFYECAGYQGRAINWAVVRNRIRNDISKRIWQEVSERPASSSTPCPACHRPTRLVRVGVEGQALELDVCPRCLIAWFDPGELQRLPSPETSPNQERELPPEIKEKLALWKLERMRQQEEGAILADEPSDNPLHWLIGVLGLPVELDAPAIRCWPWITWGLAATCVVIFFATWHNTQGYAKALGLIPADLFRLGGLTIFTSLFLHADIWHLLGNMYFLLVFGDNTEDALGRLPYLGLLLLGQVLGSVCHAAFFPSSKVPCVGASAAISAVLVFYAMSFPRTRIAFMFRYYLLIFKWIRFPVAVGLILWITWQLVLAAFQLQGLTNVSALGHLGGDFAGLAFWFVYRMSRTGDLASPASSSV